MKLLKPQEVQEILEQALPGARASVEDLTGTRDHYKVIVVSPAFEGKMLLERHRMVNRALEKELQGPIHALTIEAYTEAQWREKQKTSQKPASIKF